MHLTFVLHEIAVDADMNIQPVWSVTQDETIKYKAALRTMDIFSKHHSVQHDIITGHPLVANYIMPSKPEGI